jgi:hypothetical protein
MKGKYVYQGIKSSVITLPDADDEIVEYVKFLSDDQKSQKHKVKQDEDRKDFDEKLSEEDDKLKEGKKEIEKVDLKRKFKKQLSLPEIPQEKELSQHIENNPPNQDSAPVEHSSVKIPIRNEKPPISYQKERLISPIPKDLSSGLPKSPINIK